VPTNLVIVESPAKAKTIKRFLGKDYVVEASMGHVRDLPTSGLGVDVDKGFEPTYDVPKEKATTVKKLKDALKDADELWIATDEDREGEAIGWHLTQVLKVKDVSKVKRIVFHEITEEAIRAAVENPRSLDMKLVDAQQARRILDRLVGYTLSPFLWKKVYSGLSAGRVQSVAVRIIVDREREIQAFNAREYWSLEAMLENGSKQAFSAMLDRKNGEKIEPATKEETDAVLKEVEGKDFSVSAVEEKEVQRNPAAPFTTSTLQQEASRKLGFSVKQTMVVAQQLYEGVNLGKGEGSVGLITYMRTDSVNLSSKALTDTKDVIEKLYGREYVLAESRSYKTKAKGAQEAHEAIRPTELARTPESVASVLDHQQLKLYTLIWNRTVATQMPPAEFKRVAADIAAGNYSFRATGQTMLFDGFMRVYLEGRDDEEAGEDGEKILPPLAEGDALTLQELKPEQHFTKPPARYTEASLVKKLEEEGIGRPSTYAPTISTVQQRGYIRKEGRQLVPEEIAFTVTTLLSEHFPNIVDLTFTAQMEQSLDDVAEGKQKGSSFLGSFYGPFKALVDAKTKVIKKSDVLKEHVVGIDPATGLEVIARTGRFGPYVQLGRFEETKDEKGKKKKAKKGEGPKTASLPKNVNTEEVTLEQAMSLLQFPRSLGVYEGEPVHVHLGRFGPYVKWGTVTGAIPKETDPAVVTIEQAIQIVKDGQERKKKAAEPLKILGKNKEEKEVSVKDGRYGPYVTDGTTNCSLPKRFTPESITLDEALELLEKKKAAGPRKPWKRKSKE
jgi:DNA topoisomerase-1